MATRNEGCPPPTPWQYRFQYSMPHMRWAEHRTRGAVYRGLIVVAAKPEGIMKTARKPRPTEFKLPAAVLVLEVRRIKTE
jgi:hypothetical protein